MGVIWTIIDKILSMSTIKDKELTVGGRLRLERKRIGMTQEELATAVGIHTRTQANYELAKGKHGPGLGYFEALRKTGIDAAYVQTGIKSGPDADLARAAVRESVQAIRAAAYFHLLNRITILLGMNSDSLGHALDQAYKITLDTMLVEGEELEVDDEKLEKEMNRVAMKLLHDEGIKDFS